MHAEIVPWLSLVGIGEDGVSGLSPSARAALEGAQLIAGSTRTLALLPPHLHARSVKWPSPMMEFVDEMLARERGRAIVVLASGDPMFFGIGGSIARRIAAAEFVVHPQLSSFALACARLGWPHEETLALSVVSRSPDRLRAALFEGRRIIVLCEDGTSPAKLATLLVDAGFGRTTMTVFEALGGPHERRIDGAAASWRHARVGDLNLVALTVAAPNVAIEERLGCVPGLPDDAFVHDGALTKRDVRAIVLARLAPRPGELLWDVGAGSGSIAIEWMRAHPTCRAFAFERDATRAARIAANARTLGVPDLRVIGSAAPAAFAACERPQAIFIGGGVSAPGVLDAALASLASSGRLVANAVTLEAERVLLDAQATHGGELVRIAIDRAGPVGTMQAWRPALPLVQWIVHR